MLNLVVFEGVIAQRWTHDGTIYFRLACQREPGLPRKANSNEDSDYLTVLVPPGPIPTDGFNVNRRVRVTGYLQSRGYDEPIAKALKKAKGLVAPIMEKLTPELMAPVVFTRMTNELVAQQIVFVDGLTQRPAIQPIQPARKPYHPQQQGQRAPKPAHNGSKDSGGAKAEMPAPQTDVVAA